MSTMMGPALIIIIIVLMYFLYVHKMPKNKKKMSKYSMVSKTMTPAMMYSAAPSVRGQEQSRRVINDRYGVAAEPVTNDMAAEYMHNKHQYLHAIINQPNASNYNEYMISTGLESAVVDSHNDYADEIQNKTTGASTETVFSHSDDIVPSWGLRRRSAIIPINPNSKDVPSLTNDQLQANGTAFRYGLF